MQRPLYSLRKSSRLHLGGEGGEIGGELEEFTWGTHALGPPGHLSGHSDPFDHSGHSGHPGTLAIFLVSSQVCKNTDLDQ